MVINFKSWLRTVVGCAAQEVDLPEEVSTIGDLAAWLAGQHPHASDLLSAPGELRFIIERRYVDIRHEIAGAPRVEIYPPVTGG